MKPVTSEEAEHANDLFNSKLERHEQDRFLYNCRGNCEPGLFEDTIWAATRYSSIRSLEKYVNDLEEEASQPTERDEEEEDSSK